MATGQVSVLPENVSNALAEALGQAAERAASRQGGWQDHAVRIGPHLLRLRTCGPLLNKTVRRAFGPLIEYNSSFNDHPISAELRAWDSISTGVPHPAPEWQLPGRFQSATRVLTCDVDHPQLTLSDSTTATAMVWIPDASAIASWESAAPFRPVLDRLLGDAGTVFVHAGVVAIHGRGVLLTGPGGSGKSTTVLACAASGLDTLGDDFVLLDDGEGARQRERRTHALYATARIRPDSPVWSLIRGPIGGAPEQLLEDRFGAVDSMGKHLIAIDEAFPGRMVRASSVHAVVVPNAAHKEPTPRLVPISAAQALRALAPTTLALTEARADAFSAMASLCAAVPCFELRVTPDLRSVVECVASLIDGGP